MSYSPFIEIGEQLLHKWAASAPKRWPQGRFNLSGFGAKDHLIQDLLAVSARLGLQLPVSHVHGCPDVPLNSGRISRARLPSAKAEQLIQYYNQRQIGVLLTFSRYDVTSPMLLDDAANYLLDAVWRGNPRLNGVTLSSPLVNEYVKSTYPGLTRHASILKVVAENGKGRLDYYRKAASEYDVVTIHPDDTLDERIIDGLLDLRDRIEMLVNESCLIHCPYRHEHYHLLGTLQGDPDNKDIQNALAMFNDRKCRSFELAKQLHMEERNVSISGKELTWLCDRGFWRFKLQGRNDDDHVYMYDCSRFLFDDDVVGPFIFKLFCQSEEYGIHKINKAAAP